MRITSVEIANLWGKKKITLPIKHRVTFLTGTNGSGKSTLLNVIHDTLNQNFDDDNSSITSKCSDWVALVNLEDKIRKLFVCMKDDDRELTKSVAKSLSSLNTLDPQALWENIKDTKRRFYSEKSDNSDNKYIYSSRSKTGFNPTRSLLGKLAIETDPDTKEFKQKGYSCSSIIFQEDRLYDKRGLTSTFSDSPSWQNYKITIDDRYESLMDDIKSFELKYSRRSEEVDPEEARDQLAGLDAVISKLNSYLESENKKIAWDDDQKITLKDSLTGETIPWYMLSRGEKTLIYLFLTVFLYKDKHDVFLLDEPEISLHVSWQHNLLKDLSDIAKDKSFIVATHSPSLVQKGWHTHCLDISKL